MSRTSKVILASEFDLSLPPLPAPNRRRCIVLPTKHELEIDDCLKEPVTKSAFCSVEPPAFESPAFESPAFEPTAFALGLYDGAGAPIRHPANESWRQSPVPHSTDSRDLRRSPGPQSRWLRVQTVSSEMARSVQVAHARPETATRFTGNRSPATSPRHKTFRFPPHSPLAAFQTLSLARV
ncbi:hypothetical protein M422DRAFT_35157 [Sphaerobolus stellatus SS14]|uniref:Uncharacterized protein n=1 Tax=Sphaerobolus stellatus (strain SS14) TaxID=990650 RepID=A0A0C9UHK1_SPHS4|nr:hypothetical protein M422DRAFT_35157 [Sphaerobolus stellatus SS14]